MLKLIEAPKDVRAAQLTLTTRIGKLWKNADRRRIAWRPASKVLNIFHNDTYWFATHEVRDALSSHHWNSFGTFRAKGNLEIAVEINVPTRLRNRRVAGFFAEDGLGGVHLMHDGSVGGGQKGVNRDSFLGFLKPTLIPVQASDGSQRLGILVDSISDDVAINGLSQFIKSVLDFKAAVRAGETARPQALRSQQQYRDYFEEFSGRKKRGAQAEIAYITRHGDVVRAVRSWRPLSKGETEVKSVLIDWGIRKGADLVELYEIKTNCDRQALYAGLGQLLTHRPSPSKPCKLVLVLPKNDSIPDDIWRAAKALGISFLRYKLTPSFVQVIGMD